MWGGAWEQPGSAAVFRPVQTVTSVRPASSSAPRGLATLTVTSAPSPDILANTGGNILLTTGSKELSVFAGLDPQRIFARVLPTYDGINACEALGLPHRHILALQGPFSQKLNEAVLEQHHGRRVLSAGTALQQAGCTHHIVRLNIPVAAVCGGKPAFFLTGGPDGPAQLCRQLAQAGLGTLPEDNSNDKISSALAAVSFRLVQPSSRRAAPTT